jgi:formylglycine-generating enzyme required for sulfatase activity
MVLGDDQLPRRLRSLRSAVKRSAKRSWLVPGLLGCLAGSRSLAGIGMDHVDLYGTNRIELIQFAASTFMMGCPASPPPPWAAIAENDAKPEHRVSLSAFSIGKYPVTVAQYCGFLSAVGFRAEFTDHYTLLRDMDQSSEGAFSPKQGMASFPVRAVSPSGAEAFCRWVSAVTGRKCRLPSEAEWEFVAKGTQSRTYPWGEMTMSANPYGSAVGRNPSLATPEGVQDLDGPVYQYCLDKFNENFYRSSPVQDPVCTSGIFQVVRGGPMFNYNGHLRMAPTWRRFEAPEASALNGFRIMIELEELRREGGS